MLPCLCFVAWKGNFSCYLVCVLKLDKGMFRVALFVF
jgi:hypothetical protein